MHDGPLTGLRVIDASTILAGPLCCQILGDFGADVIKVEHPVAGDSMRGHGHAKDGIALWWKEISRNKRTIGLKLSTPEGADLLRRLAATADVLVENFRPGTLERWGISPEQLWELNPGLVIVRISGFGQKGPYAHRPGFGTLAEAMSGFAHLTGEADGPPTLPAFGLADSICGIAASSATMVALWARTRNGGKGQVVDLSLLEPIMTAVGPGPTVYDQLGVIGHRHGNRSTNNAPATPTAPRTATGSRCPPAPRPSPNGCCVSSGTPRSSTNRGSPPDVSAPRTPTCSTTTWAVGSPNAPATRSCAPSKRPARPSHPSTPPATSSPTNTSRPPRWWSRCPTPTSARS